MTSRDPFQHILEDCKYVLQGPSGSTRNECGTIQQFEKDPSTWQNGTTEKGKDEEP